MNFLWYYEPNLRMAVLKLKKKVKTCLFYYSTMRTVSSKLSPSIYHSVNAYYSGISKSIKSNPQTTKTIGVKHFLLPKKITLGRKRHHLKQEIDRLYYWRSGFKCTKGSKLLLPFSIYFYYMWGLLNFTINNIYLFICFCSKFLKRMYSVRVCVHIIFFTIHVTKVLFSSLHFHIDNI